MWEVASDCACCEVPRAHHVCWVEALLPAPAQDEKGLLSLVHGAGQLCCPCLHRISPQPLCLVAQLYPCSRRHMQHQVNRRRMHNQVPSTAGGEDAASTCVLWQVRQFIL